MKARVYIEAAGCNRCILDIKTICSYLESNNCKLVNRPEDADKILVTTCALTKLEEDESIQRAGYFKKYGSEMAVYECLPDIAQDRYNQEFADLPKVAPRENEKIEQFFPADKKGFTEVAAGNLIGTQSGRRKTSFLPEKVPAKTIKKKMRKAFKHFAKVGIHAYYKGGYANETQFRSKLNVSIGNN